MMIIIRFLPTEIQTQAEKMMMGKKGQELLIQDGEKNSRI